MPIVSVIIPTYNRAEIILKSINSVLNQSFEDFELIIVDDGSTDNTIEVIQNLDPRLKIISQKNSGVSAARNTGINASKGKYLAFLDSDDEWKPLYLEACVAFLENHPEESVVHTEFIWNLNKNLSEIQPYTDIPRIFLPLAKKVGSKLLDLPSGETDHYLRIYKEKIPLGEWAENFLKKMQKPITHYYRGDIFEHWRWGYLMTVWSTVFKKDALNKIGRFEEEQKRAGDYCFLTKLCKFYKINFLPFPGAIKNEFRDGGQVLKEDHLASGKNILNFAIDYLDRYEKVFLFERPDDRELLKIKAQNQTYISEIALQTENKIVARNYAKAALEIDPEIFRAKLILFLLHIIPGVKISKWIYKFLFNIKKMLNQKSYFSSLL